MRAATVSGAASSGHSRASSERSWLENDSTSSGWPSTGRSAATIGPYGQLALGQLEALADQHELALGARSALDLADQAALAHSSVPGDQHDPGLGVERGQLALASDEALARHGPLDLISESGECLLHDGQGGGLGGRRERRNLVAGSLGAIKVAGRQRRPRELVCRHGIGQALELDCTEVREVVATAAAGHDPGHLGEQDLAAARPGAQPRCLHHGRAVVVAVVVAGVAHGDPDPDFEPIRSRSISHLDPLVHGYGAIDRRGGAGEDGHDAVTEALDLPAPRRGDGFAQQTEELEPKLIRALGTHARGKLRRPDQVCEQHCDSLDRSHQTPIRSSGVESVPKQGGSLVAAATSSI